MPEVTCRLMFHVRTPSMVAELNKGISMKHASVHIKLKTCLKDETNCISMADLGVCVIIHQLKNRI